MEDSKICTALFHRQILVSKLPESAPFPDLESESFKDWGFNRTLLKRYSHLRRTFVEGGERAQPTNHKGGQSREREAGRRAGRFWFGPAQRQD